MRGMKHNSCG